MLGSRGTETGINLYNLISVNNPNAQYMSDYWKAYEEFLPVRRHTKSKAETYTVEGYNSLLRHYLARLKRKTKCYTKCPTVLYYSILLLTEKLKGQLSILY